VRLKNSYIVITLLALVFSPAAICAQFLWSSHIFGPITLPKMSHRGDVCENHASIIMDVNKTLSNIQISANNTEHGPAELTNGKDRLVTEYKLTFDGDGIHQHSGGADTEYVDYKSFLLPAVAVKYVYDDNQVVVTLWVRASNYADKVADFGSYTATQTLTVSWIDP
jgi:hypothetical protein